MLTETTARAGHGFVTRVLAVIAGQVGCALIALVAEICYARFLGPEGRGQLSLCLMLSAFGVLVAGMGGEGAIILWRADPSRNARPWLPAVLLWGLLGCILTCGLAAFAYWHYHPAFLRGLSGSLALLVILTVPVSVLFDYQLAMLVGEERFGARAILGGICQLAGLVGFAAFLLRARTPYSALLGNLFGVVLAMFVAFFWTRGSFRKFWDLPSARANLFPTLSFAMRGQFGLVASFFNYRLDVFVINYFLDSAQLGLYALGVVIAEALWQIPAAAAVVLFPRTAHTLNEGADEFTCRILRHVLVISTAVAAADAFAAWLFVPLLFGQRFAPSVVIVWLLLPGTLALSLARIAASDLSGRGHSGYSSAFSTIALAVTIALDFVLIPSMGIKGAAIASSVAYLINTVLLLAALKHETKVPWRSLLVPARTEFGAYRLGWLRFREWLHSLTFLSGRRSNVPTARLNSAQPQ